jgi:8-oxo-dGTP pyrophosphatase MutT (NUDIX family)
MTRHLNKVTAFILRTAPTGRELLLIEHPHAGIQLPAGTAEPGEDPLTAIRREAREESGLDDLPEPVLLRSQVESAPAGFCFTVAPSPVFSRPDPGSFGWAAFRAGLMVRILRKQGGYTQVAYEELDSFPVASYITYNITGWVPDDTLGRTLRRHFFHFDHNQPAPPRWTVRTDNHVFALFWAPLDTLPEITAPQDQWVKFIK